MADNNQLSLRHVAFILLRAFLFFGSIFAQPSDSVINFSQFWHEIGDDIPIYLDETSQNTFQLNLYNPNTQSDGYFGALMIDGGLGVPLGSYEMPRMLPPASAADSAYSTSQINYRQGDYGYKELGIGAYFQQSDSSNWQYRGLSRTAPVTTPFSSLGNALQNHLLSYRYFAENSSVSWDFLYHREDVNLPVHIAANRRQVESFHSGAVIEKKVGRFAFKLHPAFQFSQLSRWTNKSTHFSYWNRLSVSARLNDAIKLLIRYDGKVLSSESENENSANNWQIISPSLEFEAANYQVQLGAAFYNESLRPLFSLNYTKNHWRTGAGSRFQVNINPLNSLEYSTKYDEIYYMNTGYYHNRYNVLLEVNNIRSRTKDYLAFFNKSAVQLSWLNFENKAGIYLENPLSKMAESVFIDYFNRAVLQVSPNVWFWKNSRYQPFAAFESTYIQYSGGRGIDPLNLAVIEIIDGLQPYSSLLLNGEFGILVKSFKLSYRWINMPGFNVKNSINDNSPSITTLRHLEIVWQFWN